MTGRVPLFILSVMRTDMTGVAMTEILGMAYLGLQMQKTIIKMISDYDTSSNNYKHHN